MPAPYRFKGLRFRPSWKLSLFVVTCLPIVLGLGFWQVSRGQQQATFEVHQQQMRQRRPVPLSEIRCQAQDCDLRPVSLQGELEPIRIWRDNRTWRGQAGYELLVPMSVEAIDADAVLVNLGWVAAGQRRSQLPQVELPEGQHYLTGQMAPLQPPAKVFGPALERVESGLRVQHVDLEALAEALDLELYPRVVVADPGSPGVQTWNFQAARMTAARHYGYATQWFGLALVLVVGWCAASFRRTATAATGTEDD